MIISQEHLDLFVKMATSTGVLWASSDVYDCLRRETVERRLALGREPLDGVKLIRCEWMEPGTVMTGHLETPMTLDVQVKYPRMMGVIW